MSHPIPGNDYGAAEFRELGLLHGTSNCCGAEMYQDICIQCEEHCEDIDTCQLCGGDGYVIDMSMVFDYHHDPIGPSGKRVECVCKQLEKLERDANNRE